MLVRVMIQTDQNFHCAANSGQSRTRKRWIIFSWENRRSNFLLVQTPEAMPKAAKERAKHSASLAAQIQNDKDPQVSVSKRAKMKRKAQDEAEAEQSREQVIEGKLGRQILTMAREQMDDEDEDDSEQENEMKWREAQV